MFPQLSLVLVEDCSVHSMLFPNYLNERLPALIFKLFPTVPYNQI